MSSTAQKHFVRRIFLPHELEQIQEQQRDAREFVEHYPQHMAWLDKALREVSEGRRVLFGVFRSAINPHGQPYTDLVGSLMLKRKSTDYTSVRAMEIKNLYILKKYRGEDRGKALYAEAERYCAQHGYSQITTEVPCVEINTVNFLLKQGFNFYETKLSPYTNNEYLYTMVKPLFPSYTGDYFDVQAIALWLCNNYYGFSEVQQIDDTRIEFQFGDDAALANVDDKFRPALAISGVMMVDDESASFSKKLAETVQSAQYQTIMVLTRRVNQFRDIAPRDRLKVVDLNTIYEAFSEWFARRQKSFPRREISGMIVPINPSYFEDILEQSINSTELVYFKTGDTGKYLKPGDTILVYVEPSQDYPNSGIRGYGKVVSTYLEHPDKAWEKLKQMNTIFEEPSFRSYVGNSDLVLAIQIGEFKEVERLPLETVSRLALINFSYYSRYFYVSDAILDSIRDEIRFMERDEPLPKVPQTVTCFISYSRKDSRYAEELEKELREVGVKVWRDLSNIKPGSPWPEALEEALNESTHVLFIATPQSRRSEYVQDELTYAKQKGKSIVPLLYEQVELPLLLVSTQYIDFRHNRQAARNTLLGYLGSNSE